MPDPARATHHVATQDIPAAVVLLLRCSPGSHPTPPGPPRESAAEAKAGARVLVLSHVGVASHWK
eukprot:11867154-Alexandrium_andersonii.AAC.1